MSSEECRVRSSWDGNANLRGRRPAPPRVKRRHVLASVDSSGTPALSVFQQPHPLARIGSMWGEKAKAVVDELRAQLSGDKILEADDWLQMDAFAGDIKCILSKRRKARVDVDRALVEPYLAAVDAGGATALYSAIKQGIRTFSTVHPEDPKAIIALTDGEDSGIPGKTTHQEACALLNEHGLRNFSFYLVGVGLRGGTCAQMRELCAPDSAHFIECGSDYGSVKKAIEQTMTKVGQSLRFSVDIDLGAGGLPPAMACLAPAMWAAGTAAMLEMLPQHITNGFANRPSGLPHMGSANGMLGIRDITGNPRQAHGVQHTAPAQGQQAAGHDNCSRGGGASGRAGRVSGGRGFSIGRQA